MFPVSGNWETRVSGITVVKKNWADAIDASFNGLYGGTKSLVSMLLDGAGYQASSVAAGGLALGITEADDVPNIGINTSVATRLLVLKVPASLSGNAVYIRCFVSATYGLEWTFNAKWVSGAWAPDYAHSSTYCTRQTIDSSSFNAKWHAATGTWNDAAWTSLANFTQAGGVSFPSSGVSALGELTGLHLIGTATTPTVTPNALGSGTGATATVTGNDICGRIALTTGTNMTTAPNNVLTVTLGSAYTNKPIVLLQNLSSVETNVYVDDSQTTTNTFTLKTTGVSLTSGSPQSYGWGYHILGR